MNRSQPLSLPSYACRSITAGLCAVTLPFLSALAHAGGYHHRHGSDLSEAIYGEFQLLDIDIESDIDAANNFNIDKGRRAALGYRLNPQLAMEFGYNNFDHTRRHSGLSSDIDLSGYTVGLKGFLPLSDRAELWGSMGLFFWDLDHNSSSLTDNRFEEGEDIYFGFGINLHLNEQLYAGFGYSSYIEENALNQQGSSANSDLNQDLFSVGVGLKF